MKLTTCFFILLGVLSVSEASAAQCKIVYKERGSVVEVFEEFGAKECRQAMARCLKMANRHNGRCQDLTGRRSQRGDHRRYQAPRGHNSYDIRMGEVVYPLSWEHDKGAEVLQYNHRTDEFKVKSKSSGNVFSFKGEDLSKGEGCLGQLCVGDLVHPSSWNHARGAIIFAINMYAQKYMVKSKSSGNVFTFNISDLSSSTGCTRGICVGDKVYPLSWEHDKGAQVIGIDIKDSRDDIVELKVKSNSSGNVFTFKKKEVALPKGCLDGFCVGDTVYPSSWNHSRGAQVIAISKRQQKFLVKSNSSGNVFAMTIYDL